jgi:hypothetical protein
MIFSIYLFILFLSLQQDFPEWSSSRRSHFERRFVYYYFSSISFPFVLFRLFCCFLTIIALEFVAAVGLNLKKEFHNGIFVIPPFLRFSARVI